MFDYGYKVTTFFRISKFFLTFFILFFIACENTYICVLPESSLFRWSCVPVVCWSCVRWSPDNHMHAIHTRIHTHAHGDF